MFKVNKKKHQNDISDVFLVFLLLTLNIFHTLILDQACNFNDF